MQVEWLDNLLGGVATTFGLAGYDLMAVLVIVLVSLICGAIGSLVVGNRMAFFSDALAHTAFAGIAVGMLFCLALGVAVPQQWVMPTVMGTFGVLVGIAI